ncbi:hypothetical protein KUCAC02_024112 [Chaenocephalus aceratus]|uniref:Uncharacterized protein n=1 Tax=Chaenocephalus aceratus TaxID=36190 RepID=A0ACB9WID0_CHAAC|nr:hypothetical protein KUCAC02_024112 [Chaenocephalus aceratus]
MMQLIESGESREKRDWEEEICSEKEGPHERCCTKSVEASSSPPVFLAPSVFFPGRDKRKKARFLII